MGTGYRIHEVGRPFLESSRAVVLGQLENIVDDALKSASEARVVGIRNACKVACAIKDGILGLLGEVFDRVVNREPIGLAEIL